MFKLDESFLVEVGLGGMSEADKAAFLVHTQEELEVRVGEALSEGLTEAQIAEFEQLIDTGASDEATKEWLAKNRPDYLQVVEAVAKGLRAEIEANAARVLGAA